jgi:hypothetical protein
VAEVFAGEPGERGEHDDGEEESGKVDPGSDVEGDVDADVWVGMGSRWMSARSLLGLIPTIADPPGCRRNTPHEFCGYNRP